MTAERPIPSYRLILPALRTATRTTAVATLFAWLIRVHGWNEVTWAGAMEAVWALRWLLGAVFTLCLGWDYAKHVMHPPRRD